MIGQAPVTQRADATRNRARILAAAERLFAQRGAEAVSMDEIAAAAGVGKGTLYRRFGDRAGLALALLDERERELQGAVLSGPPPLGPGAEPTERLGAFLAALVEQLDAHIDLYLRADAGTARYRIGAHVFNLQHIRMLLSELRPDLDVDYLADALFAPLHPELYRHQRQQDMPPERIKAGIQTLARALSCKPRRSSDTEEHRDSRDERASTAQE